jgi:hypothetical protein
MEERRKEVDAILAEDKVIFEKTMTENAIAAKRAELAQVRMPFVEMLAVRTSGNLAGATPPNMAQPAHASSGAFDKQAFDKERAAVKEYHYNQCLSLIKDSGVMAIQSDDVFETKAKEVMERYLERYRTYDGTFEATVREIRAVKLKQ